jgi:hypothetical protein
MYRRKLSDAEPLLSSSLACRSSTGTHGDARRAPPPMPTPRGAATAPDASPGRAPPGAVTAPAPLPTPRRALPPLPGSRLGAVTAPLPAAWTGAGPGRAPPAPVPAARRRRSRPGPHWRFPPPSQCRHCARRRPRAAWSQSWRRPRPRAAARRRLPVPRDRCRHAIAAIRVTVWFERILSAANLEDELRWNDGKQCHFSRTFGEWRSGRLRGNCHHGDAQAEYEKARLQFASKEEFQAALRFVEFEIQHHLTLIEHWHHISNQ